MAVDWLTASWSALGYVLLSTLGIYLALVLLTRISGLRSFSKLSSFDFAVTVAIGSLIATVLVAEDPPLLQGAVALTALYGVQIGLGVLRQRWDWVPTLVDNEPLLLMDGDQVLHGNLAKGSMTEADLRAKLREANVIDRSQVRAVVMETTGDVSVLHAPSDGPDLDPTLLQDVRDPERSG